MMVLLTVPRVGDEFSNETLTVDDEKDDGRDDIAAGP